MDYIKIRFGNELDSVECDFERTIEDMFRSMNPLFRLAERSFKPPMDIYESPAEVVILAEIAGVSKDDLEIEINQRAVKVHGVRRPLPPVDKATYRLAEIQYGRFERILYLPVPIDTDRVSAAFRDGFLTIRLAKLPRAPIHKIPVQQG